MKILIPVFSPATGTWGGLTRVMAITKAAQEAGHQVAFCASGSLKTAIEQRGYRLYPTPSSTFFGLPGPISRLVEKRSQSASLPVRPGRDFGSFWLVLMLSGANRPGYLRDLVAAELAAARDFQPDFIFTDVDPGAFLLAQITSLPIAMTYQTPMTQGIGTFPWKVMNRVVAGVQKAYHLPVQTIDQLRHGPQVLKIIPSIPELEDTAADRPDVCYTGQLLGDFKPGQFQPEAGKRYVFAYLGTGSVPLGMLRTVLPHIFPSGGNTICLVGAQSIQTVEQLGAVEFRPFVPASEVLPYCDWALCHGGQNTIVQSLLNKVPLILFPGPIFERRYNSRKVQSLGAGKMGEVTEFSPHWLRSALADQARCKAQANCLSERIDSFGGARTAVSAIEKWGR